MKITIDTKTDRRKPLAVFFDHLIIALSRGVSGGNFSLDGEPVAEWTTEPTPETTATTTTASTEVKPAMALEAA